MQTKTRNNTQTLVHVVTDLRELTSRMTFPLSIVERDISDANFANPAFCEGIAFPMIFNKSMSCKNSLILVINAATLTEGGLIVLKPVASQKERFNN